MCIAIVIPDSWEPAELVRWSSTLARSKEEHLLIIRVRRLANRHKRRRTLLDLAGDKSPMMGAIREHAGDFEAADHNDPRFQRGVNYKLRGADPRPLNVFLIDLDQSEFLAGVLQCVKTLRVVLLIVPRRQGVRIGEEEATVERQLFAEVPCEVLQLRPGKRFNDPRDPLLVTSDANQKPTSTLILDSATGVAEESQVAAVYVENDGQPSRRRVRRRVGRAVRRPPIIAKPKLPAAAPTEDVLGGVRSYAAATGHDMLIVGAGDHLTEDRKIRACVPEKLTAKVDESTIVVVRNALPLRGRLINSIEHRKRSWVPQLDRPGRIELVQRLQSTAEWDIDFLLMILLATLLAGLGLVVDSAPVVIGAMLVAPLMAPMLGLGMSVVQGNRQMADKCLRIVARGFLLAFATACSVGAIRMLFTSGLTDQMSSRGAPTVLDLAIAFVSGMVAAYAFGRPHLLSVLPGIAIATSLVPPIATSGLALLAFQLNVALGAALLFLANFVAIVLGSAFGLWVVGMRGPRDANPFTAWAQKWIFGFFGIAVCLSIFFTFRGDGSQLRAAAVALETGQVAPRSQPIAAAASGEPSKDTAATTDDRTPDAIEDAETKRQVVRKPIPRDELPADRPRVTVVLPQLSPADGTNASVQIEGMPPADVAGLLDEMLKQKPAPSHSHSALLLIVAISVISLGYFGWRNRSRF